MRQGILGQQAPGSLTTELYYAQVPTVVSALFICNPTGGAIASTIHLVGVSQNVEAGLTEVYGAVSITANTTETIKGIALGAGESIYVAGDGLVYTACGVGDI